MIRSKKHNYLVPTHHWCENGNTIRPYPSLFCSLCCMPKYKYIDLVIKNEKDVEILIKKYKDKN